MGTGGGQGIKERGTTERRRGDYGFGTMHITPPSPYLAPLYSLMDIFPWVPCTPNLSPFTGPCLFSSCFLPWIYLQNQLPVLHPSPLFIHSRRFKLHAGSAFTFLSQKG